MKVYPHEAWCPRCSVSHPLGTRRCLHCGGAVMPARPVEGGGRTFATTLPSSIEFPAEPEVAPAPLPEAGARTAPPRAPTPLRIGVNLVWIALFVAVTLIRLCSERG